MSLLKSSEPNEGVSRSGNTDHETSHSINHTSTTQDNLACFSEPRISQFKTENDFLENPLEGIDNKNTLHSTTLRNNPKTNRKTPKNPREAVLGKFCNLFIIYKHYLLKDHHLAKRIMVLIRESIIITFKHSRHTKRQ